MRGGTDFTYRQVAQQEVEGERHTGAVAVEDEGCPADRIDVVVPGLLIRVLCRGVRDVARQVAQGRRNKDERGADPERAIPGQVGGAWKVAWVQDTI